MPDASASWKSTFQSGVAERALYAVPGGEAGGRLSRDPPLADCGVCGDCVEAKVGL